MNIIIIPGIIIGTWAGCKVLGAIGLLLGDLWNTLTRQ